MIPIGEEHLAQWMFQVLIELVAYLIQCVLEDRECLIQLPTHIHTLGALTGEEQCQSASAGYGSGALGHIGGGFPTNKGIEATQELIALATQHHGAVLEYGAGAGQGEAHIDHTQPRIGFETL